MQSSFAGPYIIYNSTHYINCNISATHLCTCGCISVISIVNSAVLEQEPDYLLAVLSQYCCHHSVVTARLTSQWPDSVILFQTHSLCWEYIRRLSHNERYWHEEKILGGACVASTLYYLAIAHLCPQVESTLTFQGLTPFLCPLNMGTESVTETLEYLHTLTWLSAQEHFTGFCCHESFKT